MAKDRIAHADLVALRQELERASTVIPLDPNGIDAARLAEAMQPLLDRVYVWLPPKNKTKVKCPHCDREFEP